jgi:ribosomal protein S18 acetylase RimI-like enzyme
VTRDGGGSLVRELTWWARREGPLRALWRGLRAVRVRLLAADLFEVYATDLPPRTLAPGPGPGREVRVMERGQEAALRALVGPRAGARYAARLRRGDTCLLCLQDGELAHITWLNVGRGGLVAVGPDEGYLFDSETLAPFRGQGIHTAMVQRRLAHLAHKGCRRAVIGVSRLNGPARRVLRDRLPFTRVGLVLYLCLLGRELRLPLPADPGRRAPA